jgi:CheY-like chemotaxis protein
MHDEAGGGAVTAPENEQDTLRTEISALKASLEAASREIEHNRAEVLKAKSLTARTMAMFQQRALQMEIIRQQNEDLDRLTVELTTAKQAEEARAKELETASRLKSDFLANFSHEIRTPLNGILGYCELLSREEGSRLTPHGRRDLQVIKSNARTLLALINDILDLSKIESGHFQVVSEPVDMETLVEECAATVREYLRGKTVELTTQVEPDARLLTSDGLKLRQVLLNLLSNAAKFTETGEIVLEVRRVGNDAQIIVEDTGAGIASDKLSLIFEKFRQVDGSMTRKVGGTGLGLAIVRELSRLLGGTVSVESEVGRGTKFTVRLKDTFRDEADGEPKPPTRPGSGSHASSASGATTPPEPAPSAPTGNGERTVLLVDDDPLIIHLLKGELEREGMTVLTADDGPSALKLADHHRPAMVVLDVHLPTLDGWAVLARLKSNPALAHTAVVFISVEEQRARGLTLGAVDYLVKPFEAEQLLRVVHHHMASPTGEVLVVDDDAPTRQLISRHLRKAGFTTYEARDGVEALQRARSTRPSLVVLDLSMPGLDGFDVLRAMRAENIGAPVVVLTGMVLTESQQQVLREGMASLVQKPPPGENGLTGGLSRELVASVVAESRRIMAAAKAAALPQRILYVEDSEQNRDVVRRYLRGVFDILEAQDGEQGIEMARQERPDLILMDLSLPRVDGYEATRTLKSDPALAHTPIIVLTAHAAREDETRAQAAGCDAFLTKPVEREVLLTTIRRFLPSRPK